MEPKSLNGILPGQALLPRLPLPLALSRALKAELLQTVTNSTMLSRETPVRGLSQPTGSRLLSCTSGILLLGTIVKHYGLALLFVSGYLLDCRLLTCGILSGQGQRKRKRKKCGSNVMNLQ